MLSYRYGYTDFLFVVSLNSDDVTFIMEYWKWAAHVHGFQVTDRMGNKYVFIVASNEAEIGKVTSVWVGICFHPLPAYVWLALSQAHSQ